MSSDWWARVNFRISSRGRMVVPPLRFWKGESIRDIYQCFGTHKENDYDCNCLELDGTKMLSKFLKTGSMTNHCDMTNKTLIVSVADSLHSQRRNGQRWTMPDKSIQKVLKVQVNDCDLLSAHYKRKLDAQEAERTPPRKRRRTVGADLDTRPVKKNDHRSSVRSTNKKDDGIVRSIHRDLSRSFNSDKHSCEKSGSLRFDRTLQYCLSCDDKRKYGRRTFDRNDSDAKLRAKFRKRYPDVRDVRVVMVDLRHWTRGKVLSLRTLCEIPVRTIEAKVRDMQGRGVTNGRYWLRHVKLVIPSTICQTRQGLQKRRYRRKSPGTSGSDLGTRVNAGQEHLFNIRESRVVLSPLSTSQLKLLRRGKLTPKMLKCCSQNQKVTDKYSSKGRYKQRSRSQPPAARSLSKKKVSNCRTAPGMVTPTKKRPSSVFTASLRNEKRSSWKRSEKSKKTTRPSSDMFEDPLYACLLSSSDSDYSVNFDDSQAGYNEKQSTPLSKYLDMRDESTDRVSAKSTPTRFHSKTELKQHVSKVRRMRAKKLKNSQKKKKKKKPEKLELSSDNDSMEELSAFEQLKRALGLMDKVQQKMCDDDRYSEEDPYFADSDD